MSMTAIRRGGITGVKSLLSGFVIPSPYHLPMSLNQELIKTLHFYNFLTGDQENFPHEMTAIVSGSGFTYISNVISDGDAKRRAERLLRRIEGKKNQRASEGNPLNQDDYLQISQIGMTQYYVKQGPSYGPGTTIEEAIGLEKTILNQKRTEFFARQDKKLEFKPTEVSNTPFLKSLVLPPMTQDILENIEQVMIDFPELVENLDSGADLSSSGMIELVFAILGSIHPDDPNGWVLDYLDEFGNLKEPFDD